MNQIASKAHLHYRRMQVESASPARLILLLYDGAVRKLNQAIEQQEMGRREEFHSHVVRVQKIVTELFSALDMEKGGDVAQNLSRLYDYMIRQLALALIQVNTERVLEVRALLEELREGWQGAVEEFESAGDAYLAEMDPAVPMASVVAAPYATMAAPAAPTVSLNIAG